MRRLRLALLIAVAASISCHSYEDSPTPDEIIIHLLGPLMKVDAEASVSSNYNNASGKTTTIVGGGQGALHLSGPRTSFSAVPFTFSASIVTNGQLTPGTYTTNSSGLQATITLTDTGPLTWLATAGLGANSGSFTLVITKVTTLVTTAGGIGYEVQGTFQASLPPVLSSGATGTETATVDFSSN